MNNRLGKTLVVLGYLYLSCPILIFIIGFFKWYWAVIFSCVVCVAFYMAIKGENREGISIENIKKEQIYIAFIVIVLWVLISGIGGCSYQNSDHEARTAIFRALVEQRWPVKTADQTRGLVYYLGFWLPSAVIGKVFGFEAGYKFQMIWAVIGVFVTYYLICLYRKKFDLLPIFFLIGFSGLDFLGLWFLGGDGTNLKEAAHIEWWAMDFQYSSTTTQLFWVFNQAIPAWVATMLILNQKSCKNMFFILSTIMLTSTFPFVGLIPFTIYLVISRCVQDKSKWKEVFSIQNVVGIFVIGIVILLYLIGNISGGMIEKDNEAIGMVYEPTARLIEHLVFYLFEFGIYSFFVYKYHKKDAFFYFTVIILCLCPFIKVGSGHDFCMRASIPALLILMLFCMDTWERMKQEKMKKLYVAFTILLCIGAITPFNEIHRSIRETYWRASQGISVQYPEMDIETQLLQYGNFSGECKDNIFYKYLAK